MTKEELYRIAEEAWDGCDGCDENDKLFWINGFIRAANLFADVETLPSPDQLEEKGNLLGQMLNKLSDNQKSLDTEFSDVIRDNFWSLVDNLPVVNDGEKEKTSEHGLEEIESPYCPICEACGEDGCCRATVCHQHQDGLYCKSYLKDLEFGYKMNRFFENEISEQMPFNLRDKYNEEWDRVYDEVYKTLQ